MSDWPKGGYRGSEITDETAPEGPAMRTNKFYDDKNPIPLLAGRLAIAERRLREAEKYPWVVQQRLDAVTAECERLRKENKLLRAETKEFWDYMPTTEANLLQENARLRAELVALRPLVRRFGSQYENDDYDKALEGSSDE